MKEEITAHERQSFIALFMLVIFVFFALLTAIKRGQCEVNDGWLFSMAFATILATALGAPALYIVSWACYMQEQ